MLRFLIVWSVLAFALSEEDAQKGVSSLTEAEPKASKEINIETARLVVAEILGVLTSPVGEEGLARFGQAAKDRYNKKAAAGSVPYVKSTMIFVERFTKAVREKHGLHAGFDDDMEKISDVASAAKDHVVQHQMEDVGELVTGKKKPEREGRNPLLDELAETYLDSSTVERKAAHDKAAAIIADPTLQASWRLHPASQLYVSTMEELNKDPEFVIKILPVTYMQDPKPENWQITLNILSKFVRESDKEKVSAAIRNLMEAKAENEKNKGKAKEPETDADGYENVEL